MGASWGLLLPRESRPRLSAFVAPSVKWFGHEMMLADPLASHFLVALKRERQPSFGVNSACLHDAARYLWPPTRPVPDGFPQHARRRLPGLCFQRAPR